MKSCILISLQLILLVLSPSFLSAQTTANKTLVVYQYHVPNNGKMSDELYSYLIVDNESSFFVSKRDDFPRPENKISQEGGNVSLSVFESDEIGDYVYRSFKNDSLVFREVGSKFMSPIIVTDKWEKIDWKITDETKSIGNYNCTKAIAKFRGRSYSAWFTIDIPISSGPWKLGGLPGLILEVYDSSKEFYALVEKLDFDIDSNLHDIKFTNNLEVKMNYEEYKEYRKNYKEIYISSIKSKLPRGSGFNLRPGDIKLSYIETELH